MREWNDLLETLHSALIDELVERHPNPKPEVGLPKRSTQTTPPQNSPRPLVSTSKFVRLGGRIGQMLISAENQAISAISCSLDELAQSVIHRIPRELTRRGISPEWLPAQKSVSEHSTVIWFPFRLSGSELWLGIGI